VKTTVTIDDELVDQAIALIGTRDLSALVERGLHALIEQESAQRLARLAGSDPAAEPARRHRSSSAAS